MIFIKNGTINTITNGIIKGDILIENKKIKAIGENLEIKQKKLLQIRKLWQRLKQRKQH